MANEKNLSAAHIRYLLTLKRLDKGDGIRSVDVAEELNITKPSVNNMMNVLLEMNYIQKEPQRQIYLTEQGREKATLLERHHKKLRDILFGTELPDHTADMAICAFIAELSHAALAVLN